MMKKLSSFHATNVRREEKKESFPFLQFGPFTKNSLFSPRNQKNFHSFQERRITRRQWGARISS